MSLVFSAITPHSPILLPSIGKENSERLESTQKSYKKLADDLKKSSAETVVIISPHGIVQSTSFTMNLNPQFSCNFEEFGDFSTKSTWAGDVGLAYKIREKLETKAPLQLVSEGSLDYGCSVPLFLLTEGLPGIKIIPVYYSGLDLRAHFEFGKLFGHELVYNKEPIAIVASGDLSHRLTKDAPGGYSPKGKKFDKKLIDALKKNKPEDIINMDHKLIQEAGDCGLKSILMLLGVMDGIKHQPELLSYEAPFGVGYMVINFKL